MILGLQNISHLEWNIFGNCVSKFFDIFLQSHLWKYNYSSVIDYLCKYVYTDVYNGNIFIWNLPPKNDILTKYTFPQNSTKINQVGFQGR